MSKAHWVSLISQPIYGGAHKLLSGRSPQSTHSSFEGPRVLKDGDREGKTVRLLAQLLSPLYRLTVQSSLDHMLDCSVPTSL